MTSRPPRRRPPPRRSADDDAPGALPSRRARPPANAFRGLLIAGAVLVAGVIGVALVTGTADDLPWGAIIGVVVIMAFAFVAGRRRARALGAGDEP